MQVFLKMVFKAYVIGAQRKRFNMKPAGLLVSLEKHVAVFFHLCSEISNQPASVALENRTLAHMHK